MVQELVKERVALAQALQKLKLEPLSAIVEAKAAVQRAAEELFKRSLLAEGRLREELLSAVLDLKSISRSLRAAEARAKIAAAEVELHRALADAEADIEEAISLLERVARD